MKGFAAFATFPPDEAFLNARRVLEPISAFGHAYKQFFAPCSRARHPDVPVFLSDFVGLDKCLVAGDLARIQRQFKHEPGRRYVAGLIAECAPKLDNILECLTHVAARRPGAGLVFPMKGNQLPPDVGSYTVSMFNSLSDMNILTYVHQLLLDPTRRTADIIDQHPQSFFDDSTDRRLWNVSNFPDAIGDATRGAGISDSVTTFRSSGSVCFSLILATFVFINCYFLFPDSTFSC